MKNSIRLCCLLGILLIGQGAGAMQTDNHGIHAVPNPGKVTIDGKLDDWDLSGQVLICYDVSSLKDIYSGRVAMMHDADHLYISIHWKDPKQILDLPIREKDGLEQMRAIAVKDNSLAVILAGERKVLLLDAETGDTVKELVNLPEGLTSIAFRADGKLLLAAADKLYVADPAAAAPTVLASGLIAPHSLAVDAEGRIYVSQRGSAMNVAVFTADGKPLPAIGKVGGRPAAGFFDETGMLNPAQIALDSQGRLWVTESHQQPKRTSVWTPDGKLAFDLIGTTAYAAGGHINPFDHTVAFSEETEYRWDEARQTWRPFFTLVDALGTGFGWVTRFARVNGHEYLQVRSTARDSSMVKILVRGKDGGWRHCAEFGNVGLGKALDDADHQQWNRKFTGPLWQGRFGQVFLLGGPQRRRQRPV